MPQNELSTGKNFRRLTMAASGWVFFLIVMGAVVRVTGSGLGCPDWPLCYNQVILPAQITTWLGFFHRSVAGVAALLTIAIAFIAWRNYRTQPLIFKPALGAVAIVLFQIFLGAVTVWFNHPLVVVIHLLAAMVYLAITLFLATAAYFPAEQRLQAGVSNHHHKFYFQFLLATGAAVLFLLISGAMVTGTQSGSACLDWPLCQGEIFPSNVHLGVIIHLFHRFTVLTVGVVIAGVVLYTRRRFGQQPGLVKWSTALGLLFLAQIGVGGLNVILRFPEVTNLIHLGLAAAIWGNLIILTSIFYLTANSLPVAEDDPLLNAEPLSLRQKAAIYFKLTKPWILVLLLITTLMAMVIAAEGIPSIPLILYTLLGGALSAGGASVLNSYVDSDIDRLMSRTSRRATVTGLITPQETLLLGLGLSTLSFLVFAIFVNAISAALSTLGILYYVFFYTLYLKRSTFHNIIIGGAAGAIPPLVGWTAVTGALDLGAFYLFAIIFFWTPPHTWALALLIKKDYAQARVPMLPVVAGEKETTYQILLYSILLVTLTLLPFTFRMVSLAYFIAALALGGYFVHLAWKLWRGYNKSISRRLYKFSQLYLALLFLVMAIDRSLF